MAACPMCAVSRRALIRPLFALAGSSLLEACGSGSGRVLPSMAPPDVSTLGVLMTDELLFRPDSLRIKPGDSVIWHNVGRTGHTVTADPTKVEDPTRISLPAGAQPWDSGMLAPGQSWTQTFSIEGDYGYVCRIHETSGMAGRIGVFQ